jgi:uncharacterized protein YbaP (TraB family)
MKVLGLAAVLAATGLTAPAAPAPDDPEGTVVSELVVQAKAGGPAWWRVSRGASMVWVIGMPGGLPRGVKWNDALLAARLTGARRLIIPSIYSAGLGDLFGALALRQQLKTRQPIEATLPSDLRARFLADSAMLREPPGHYDGWKPAVAGLLMVGDLRKRAGMDERQPLNAIRAAAGHKGVRVTPAASYKAMSVLKAMAGDLTLEVNLACLADSLQEVEAGSDRIHAAAEAWARGDVRGALSAERGYEKCLASFPEFTAVVRQSMADEVGAIAHDLQSPGVSVAAIPLRALVARDGVLAQLQARGYEVHTPASD